MRHFDVRRSDKNDGRGDHAHAKGEGQGRRAYRARSHHLVAYGALRFLQPDRPKTHPKTPKTREGKACERRHARTVCRWS